MHRWCQTHFWEKWRSKPPKIRKKTQVARALNASTRPMPFPVVPEAVVRWGNGLVWKQFARVVQPVMDKRGLQWIQHKGALGDSVWMPLPTNDTEPETQVLLQTARVVAQQCEEAIKQGLQTETAQVGAPKTQGCRKASMPRAAISGCPKTSRSIDVCQLMGMVCTWEEGLTDLGRVVPPKAMRVRQACVRPHLLDDAVCERVSPTCESPWHSATGVVMKFMYARSGDGRSSELGLNHGCC